MTPQWTIVNAALLALLALCWVTGTCFRKRGHGKDGLYCKQHAKKHPAKDGP